MTKKMKSAPLYFTIGQVKHNPLLNLNSYIPAIQERMRKAGFPDFKRATQVQIDLTLSTANRTQEVERFQFSNTENTQGFVLGPDALSFMTTDYDTFEPFLTNLKLGLEILGAEVGGLSFTERLGLRYLDAIVPKAGEPINQYIEPHLQGLPGGVQASLPNAKFAYSFAESTLIDDEVGKIVARAIIQNGPLGFPPDLQPVILQMSERFREFVGEHAVLDTDGSFTERRSFSMEEVEARLHQLHKLIGVVFRASVTDYARKAWGEEEEQ